LQQPQQPQNSKGAEEPQPQPQQPQPQQPQNSKGAEEAQPQPQQPQQPQKLQKPQTQIRTPGQRQRFQWRPRLTH